MIVDIERHAEEIARLCRQFGVRRLEVFGSAANGRFDPASSDLDFLVSFEPMTGASLFRRYFGLLEALEKLFGRKIDMVSADAMRNPYFIAEAARSRQTVYASSFAEAA